MDAYISAILLIANTQTEERLLLHSTEDICSTHIHCVLGPALSTHEKIGSKHNPQGIHT